jgi:four helix bundle protein
MIIRRYRDLRTWQLTEEFNERVMRLVRESQEARRNFRYRDQLLASAAAPSKHVAEGFLRFSPTEFCRFLDYAVSSVGEAENHLTDGVKLQYFTSSSVAPVLELGNHCTRSILALNHS